VPESFTKAGVQWCRSMRAERAIAGCLVVVSVVASACGGAQATTPLRPSSMSGGAVSGSAASAYLNEVLTVMETNSINRGRINWSDFRLQVLARAQAAQSIPDTYPAISVALGLLDDHHSFYTSATGSFIGNPSSPRCAAPAAAIPVVPADVGYVRIAAFGGPDVQGFADSVQGQIRAADRADLAGWVVDLRGNTGGNMWPMLAGVGPVLGGGIAGYFFPPSGSSSTWTYSSGLSALNGVTQAAVSSPYVLMRPSPRVAVLIDSLVASSGEAIAISFRARPNTRSFGAATCGLSTANGSYRLSDGAMLLLTTALMADRTGMSYGNPIPADETVAGDAAVVNRAIAWLRNE
jgi:carboxyl-terminal processing protease